MKTRKQIIETLQLIMSELSDVRYSFSSTEDILIERLCESQKQLDRLDAIQEYQALSREVGATEARRLVLDDEMCKLCTKEEDFNGLIIAIRSLTEEEEYALENDSKWWVK